MPTRAATGWYPVADFDPRRLIQAQRLACLSRRDLAQAAGLDPLTIQSWETGVRQPRPDQLAKVAEVLGYPPRFFLYGRPYMAVDPMALHRCGPRD